MTTAHRKKVVPQAVLALLGLSVVLGALPANTSAASRQPAIAIKPASHNRFIMATVNTQAPIKAVQLRVDSKQVKPQIQWQGTKRATVRYSLDKVALGTHLARVSVWDRQNRVQHTQWKVHKLEALGLTADRTNIRSEDTVMLTGQGFIPGYRVWVSMGGVNTEASGDYGSVIVNQQGRFSLPVKLAQYPVGSPLHADTIVLVAHTKAFKQKATVQLQVLGNPTVSASKTSIQPGERITLTGEGFTPSSTLSISMGGQNTGAGGNYGTATADHAGTFSLDVTLSQYPDGTPLHAGAITLLAHNTDGSEKAAVQLQVLAQPALAVSTSTIRPGDHVSVTGTGFTPGTAISIAMGSVNSGAGGNYGATTVDSQGRFSLDVTLAQYPDGSPLHAGTIVLLAHNADGSEKATVQLQVTAAPVLHLGATTIRPGDRVAISGEGFTPGMPITIGMGGVNTGASGNYGTAVVDAQGRFALQVTLDRYPNGSPLQPGTIALLAHNADGSEKAGASLQVLAIPTLTANKPSLRPGEPVVLTGQGFTPGVAVMVSMGGPNTGASGNYGSTFADANGHVSLVVAPARYPDGSPLRPNAIVLMAHTPGFEEKASVQLQILATPVLSVDRNVIQPGDTIMVNGQGFTPGMPITLSIGGPNSGASGNYGTAIIDASGRFALSVRLDRYPNGSPLQAGPIVLVAHNAGFSEQATVQLQVVTLSANKTAFKAGEQIVLTGHGFIPGTTAIISLGGLKTGATGNYGTAVVQANGTFSLAVAPSRYPDGSPLQPGMIVLVAHDSFWAQQAALQIQVQAPAARPAAPSNLQVVSVTKGATSAEPTMVALRWQDNAVTEDGFHLHATVTRMYGGTENHTGNVPANTTTSTMSFVAGGINPITRVCFTVTAFNAHSESAPSNQVCVDL